MTVGQLWGQVECHQSNLHIPSWTKTERERETHTDRKTWQRASSDAVAFINSPSGDKSVVQKQETFDGDDQMDQMGTSGENVSGSVAAFVTTGGQNLNIIHGGYGI